MFTVEKDWVTEAGYRAVVIMGDRGTRCGYVAVPAGHPLFGVDYSGQTPNLVTPDADEEVGKRGLIPLLCAQGQMDRPDIVFDVHGSLTYSGGGPKYPVEAENVWWFGYDCAHHNDAASPEHVEAMKLKYPDKPFMWCDGSGFSNESVHRTLDYCVAECESLAEQLTSRVKFPCNDPTKGEFYA